MTATVLRLDGITVPITHMRLARLPESLHAAGACACGAVRFEVRLDVHQPSRRCNCSYCGKQRLWKAFARDADLRVLAGEESLASYRFGEQYLTHCFCRRCGVHVFARSDCGDPSLAVHVINVAALDDSARAALAAVPVRYENGRDDDWWRPPAETRHL